MKQCVAIVCALLAVGQANPASIKYRKRREADVSHVDPAIHLSIRSPSNDVFPNTLAATLIFADGREVVLTLKKNQKLTFKPPGNVDDSDADQVAYYTEKTYKASFVVVAHTGEDGVVNYSMEGVVFVDGQHMVVQEDVDGVLRVKASPQDISQGVDDNDNETVTHPRIIDVIYREDTPFGDIQVLEKVQKQRRGNSNKGGRKTRSSPENTQFDVETLFVIDHTIYDYWMSILFNPADVEYQITYMYTNYMNSMQLVFASIDESVHNIRITPRLSDIVIQTTPAESYMSVGSITDYKGTPGNCTDPYDCVIGNGTAFLLNVAQWKKDQGLAWNNPDHLIVFTMYDIINPYTVGYGPVGEVCNGFNSIGFRGGIAVVEDIGFSTWHVMAHELGHNLGSFHDADIKCPSALAYIMSPASSVLNENTVDNFHTFSTCSISSMKDQLTGACAGSFCNPKTCLQDNLYTSQVFRSTMQLLGETISLDTQCKNAMGSEYTYYNDGSLDGFCMTLKCHLGTSYTLSSLMAADGTPCGPVAGAQWCIQGHCVAKTTVEYETSQSSVFTCSDPPTDCADTVGHTTGFNGASLTCADIEAHFPNLCWMYPSVREGCTATCHRMMCDLEAESPCSEYPAGGGGVCADWTNILINDQTCPDFCNGIKADGMLDAYKTGWSGTCHYCCMSCECSP